MPQDNRPPAFMFYPNDFSSDDKVEAMSTEAVGCYVLLLCKAWRSNPPATLPDDDGLLARWARVSETRWYELKPQVLSAWTLTHEKRWLQRRLKKEWDKQRQRRVERSTSGKKGAAKRWQSHGGANGSAIAKESVSETEIESVSETLVSDESGAVEIRAVFDHYRKYHPRAFKKPTSKSKEWNLIKARMREGSTVEDLMRAIDGNHRSPWHCGENPGNQQYHDLELIVRNGSKVTAFQQFADGPPPVVSEKSARTLRAAQDFLADFGGDGNGKP